MVIPNSIHGLTSIFGKLPQLSPSDRLIIERAFAKAEKAHRGQTRQSGEPYITHCIAVATILVDMKLDAEAIAAALMHDIVEDTNVTIDEIRNEFGSKVAMLIDGVTKLKKIEIGRPREENINSGGKNSYKYDREMEYFRKMFLTIGDDIRVVLIKLADRLHNMRTLQ